MFINSLVVLVLGLILVLGIVIENLKPAWAASGEENER